MKNEKPVSISIDIVEIHVVEFIQYVSFTDWHV